MQSEKSLIHSMIKQLEKYSDSEIEKELEFALDDILAGPAWEAWKLAVSQEAKRRKL